MQAALENKPIQTVRKISAFLDLIFSEPYLYAFFALIALKPRMLCDVDVLIASVLKVEEFPLFRMATYGIVTLVLICYVLRWLMRDIKRVNPTLISILCMFLYLALITFAFDGASGYHMDWHAGFALMMMIDMGLQRERKSLIRGLTGALECWVYLNVISFVLFPQTMGKDLWTPEWILGNRAFYYRIVFPALGLALTRYYVLGKSWLWRTVLLVLGCLICFAVQKGGTALIGLVLLLGLMLWCNRRALARYLTPLLFTGLAAAVFAGIYFFEAQRLFEPLIVDVLGKSITLSSRTAIWDIVVPLIEKNPISGVGYLPVAFLRKILGGATFSHTHNQLLLLMLHGGVIATGFYLAALFFASREALRCRRSVAVKTMTLLVCVFAIMGISEIFHNDPIYYALFIFLSRADCLTEDVKQLPRISMVKRIKRDLKRKKVRV